MRKLGSVQTINGSEYGRQYALQQKIAQLEWELKTPFERAREVRETEVLVAKLREYQKEGYNHGVKWVPR
jgi:hypothetical protein